jgi:uncharacterized protein (DUF111 family)
MTVDLLVIRTPSGLSGDMMLSGLTRLLDLSPDALNERVQRIGVPALEGAVSVIPRFVAGIEGWATEVSLPHEHVHRRLEDILQIIAHSQLHESACAISCAAFSRLAQVEAEIHGVPPDQITFHEVGALDSILDVCLVAELYAELGSPQVVCSPLPICDGLVRCQHGLLAAPAPATLHMLEGVPVYGIEADCETVTPTALAMLHALQTTFGGWPAMTIRRTARAYGARVIPGVPNGAIFAFGSAENAQYRLAVVSERDTPHNHPRN